MPKFLPLLRAGILPVLLFCAAPARSQAPVITTNPVSDTVCPGNDASFTVAASNTPTSYTWQSSLYGNSFTNISPTDATFEGSTTATLTVHTDASFRYYIYAFRCVATNASGTSQPSAAASLETAALFNGFYWHYTTTEVCQGASHVRFGQPMDVQSYSTYNWSYSGNDVVIRPVSADSTVELDFGPAATSGTLSVVSVGACGSSTAQTLAITVNPAASSTAGTAGDGSHCSTVTIPSSSTYNGVYSSDPSGCGGIAYIYPSGAHRVRGATTTCVTIDASVQSYNGVPYVQRYYTVEPASNASTATATLTLYYTQSDFDAYNTARGSFPALPTGPSDATGIANLKITQFHGSGTTPGTYAGSSGDIDPDDDKIVWNSAAARWEVTFDVTGFSGFFVSSSSLVTLPLTLTNISVISQNGGNLLRWTTASEENTAYFEVERNDNGGSGDYHSIATIAAAGNSHSSINYSFTDLQQTQGDLAYRLKMVDLDGQATYSRIVRIQTGNSSLHIKVLPNPSANPSAISVYAPKQTNAILTATDGSGRVILKKTIVLQQGANSFDASSLGTLQKGFYLLTLYTDTEKTTVKFIKE